MTRHPILLGLTPAIVVGLIAAVANLLNAFGIASISQEQLDSINALVPFLLLLLGAGGVGYAQNKSTPVSDPVLPQGTEVTVTTPPGQPDEKVTL